MYECTKCKVTFASAPVGRPVHDGCGGFIVPLRPAALQAPKLVQLASVHSRSGGGGLPVTTAQQGGVGVSSTASSPSVSSTSTVLPTSPRSGATVSSNSSSSSASSSSQPVPRASPRADDTSSSSSSSSATKRPGAKRRESDVNDYDYLQEFDKERLKEIKKEATRSGAKGLGSFSDVLGEAQETAKIVNAYQNDLKVGLPFFKKDVTPENLDERLRKLIVEAEKWLGAFNEEGEREKLGKVSDKTHEADKYRQAKIKACRDLIAGARISRAQLSHRDTLTQLDQLWPLVESGKARPEEVDLCRTLDASVLQSACGTQPAGGGTSEVGLIMAPDGSVAYAFKSIEGESESMGLPKGGGAAREVLVSKLCDCIKGQIDFGWPATCLTGPEDIKGLDGQPKPGVLIEGLNGKKVYDADAIFSETDVAEAQRKKNQSAAILAKLPGKEIQKLLLCNFAFAQFDIKWDNAIIQEPADGAPPAARPYDGGAALPTMDMFMDLGLRGGTSGVNLLKDHENKPLPAADEPMDAELKARFCAIDEGQLLAAMKEQLHALPKELDPRKLGLVEGCGITLDSIRAIKSILKDQKNAKLTLREFVAAYDSFLVGTVKAKEAEWLGKLQQDYIDLFKLHPGLLPDVKSLKPIDVWNNFLKPEQRDCLDRLVRAGGTATMTKYGVKCPIVMSPKGSFGSLYQKMPEADRAKHPGVFKN
jgi:hypothetical protein